MKEHDDELDCSGLNCPMPVLKTKLKIDKMDAGKVLRVITTDPGACNDLPAWASKVGHEILSNCEEGDKYVFYVKRGA
ncbi:MAG: sulfurtransferase TusA family protein [Euryarchaeota archaeon]|jgi:tRNA 2-thiouridine synthesizing protein A|nr:sulfurtransferase TusA family protein [Euryarchaeota archaeon]MBT3971970.1 sulfurtransferase TusA family protein [Euryarchaeota archaeon]MBT6644655.1 sulfurtransferase TusA family protein [Euryarchaeota archaeon]